MRYTPRRKRQEATATRLHTRAATRLRQIVAALPRRRTQRWTRCPA